MHIFEDNTDSKRKISLSLPIQLLEGDLSVYIHLFLLISHARLTSFMNEPSFYQIFGHTFFTLLSRSYCFIFIVTELLLFQFIDYSTFVLFVLFLLFQRLRPFCMPHYFYLVRNYIAVSLYVFSFLVIMIVFE